MSVNTTAPAVDEDDPFSDPASGGGLDELAGLWVIIKPLNVVHKPSKFDAKIIPVVECVIIAIDGEEPGKTVTTSSYSGSLNTQIKTKVGKMVIGLLAKKKFDKGMGWNLEPATPEAREMGKKVLADIEAREAAKAVSEDPFE